MNRCIALVVLSACSLFAQGTPPAFVPKDVPMIRLQCNGMEELRQQWPATHLGRLFADEDMQVMAAKFGGWLVRENERRVRVWETAVRLGVELRPVEIGNLFASSSPFCELRLPFAQMRRLDFYVSGAPGVGRLEVATASVQSCMPRYEGRWTQRFERDAALLRAAPWVREQPVAKVGSYDAYRFGLPLDVIEELGERAKSKGRWMLHLPGTFVVGSGVPDDIGRVHLSPARSPAGFSVQAHASRYFAHLKQGLVLPEQLDMDALSSLRWSDRFVGAEVAEELELVLVDDAKPAGLLGAFFGGQDGLAPQALPTGAIAQVRCSVRHEALLGAIEELAGKGFGLPPQMRAQLVAMLDGSISIGLCAPARGGVIPRVYVSLGVADDEACERFLAEFAGLGLPTKVVKYGGIPVTLVKLEGVPGGVQPAFCRVGSQLHLAESGLSLRAFLKAQRSGDVSMDVGDASAPDGPGERIASMETSFDLAQLYRTFYDVWLPLYELTASGNRPIRREDLPGPDLVEEHVGSLRGAAYRDGQRYVLRHQGAVGPMLGAYLMAWAPMGADELVGRNVKELSIDIAQHRLESVWSSMSSFLAREGRLPKDLAELFVAEKLADDALLIPMDDAAEEFVLPSGKRLRSSFRYFAKPVSVDRKRTHALLIEIAPRSYRRSFLSKEGQVTRMFGSESRRSIDSFGK